MTEKQRKQQNASEYISELIYQRYEEYLRDVDAQRQTEQASLETAKKAVEQEKNPLLAYIKSLDFSSRATYMWQKDTTLWLLNLIVLVAETQAMMNRETKPTQAELDALKSKVDAACQKIDEHLASRLAKLLDPKGHEAMYGASGTN
jgi:hypothetical protein